MLASAQHTITVGQNNRYCSLELTAQEWTDWNDNDAYNDQAKREALTQELYGTFEDDFDFIFYVLNNADRPSALSYTGQLIQVSNTTTGIGSYMSVFDNSSNYGSNGKLQAVMILTKKTDLLLGPSLHELAHNWGNFALDAKNFYTSEYSAIPHWGFTGCGGQLGGFAQSELTTNVDGNPNKYTALIDGDPFGTFANGGNSVKYSNFEQYLMGMIPASDLTSFDMFSGITSYDYATGTFEASTKTTYDKNSLVALMGDRTPTSATSQKDFKILVCVLTPSALSTADKSSFDFDTENFDREAPTDYNISQNGGFHNFYTATNGIGTVDLDLSQSVTSIEQVKLSESLSISDVYPNPTQGNASINVDAKKAMKLSLTISDQLGRLVSNKQISVVEGRSIVDLEIESLKPGSYVVSINNSDKSSVPISKSVMIK